MQNHVEFEIKYRTQKEAIKAVRKDGYALRFCTPELQDNEGVVWEAIKQERWALRFASERLTANKAFIMKALNEGVYPKGLVRYADATLQSDVEVMELALEKSLNGWDFADAKGEITINKKLAAKALVKWCASTGPTNFELWKELHPSLQEFFTREGYYAKAQAYLIQLEQDKQAELVSGGCTTEDEVIW